MDWQEIYLVLDCWFGVKPQKRELGILESVTVGELVKNILKHGARAVLKEVWSAGIFQQASDKLPEFSLF